MVSVVIPNYNHAPFLKERIESVLNQTFGDFEVIILDDCSSDCSREIINQYRNHPKVSHIVFNEENSGSTFRQWQKGFSLASGEYIWIAESDDVAHPEFLSSIVPIMAKHDNVIIGFSSMIRIDENSKNLGEIKLVTRGNFPIMTGESFIKNNMLLGCHILNASSAVFRRNALDKISDQYVTFIGSGDYQFWIEICEQGDVLKIDKPLDYFRHHSNKVTPKSVASGKQFEEVYRIFQYLRSTFNLSHHKELLVTGFWLNIITRCKIFQTEIIRDHVYQLWSQNYRYPRCIILYSFIFRAFRRLKEFI